MQIISDKNSKSKKIKNLLLNKIKSQKFLKRKFDYSDWWRWFYASNFKKK
jgi:hypothetical protein